MIKQGIVGIGSTALYRAGSTTIISKIIITNITSNYKISLFRNTSLIYEYTLIQGDIVTDTNNYTLEKGDSLILSSDTNNVNYTIDFVTNI